MLNRKFARASRAALVAVVGLLTSGFAASTSRADDAAPEKSAYTVSLGTDFVSHFISFGADVWGGGKDPSPFSAHSSVFGYGTVTVALNENVSVFVNMWSDLNDNVHSGIGGPIQEIDFNTGVSLTLGKVGVSLTHGFWNYAGDVEKVLDLGVSFNDAGLISDKFSINPSVTVHDRYEGDGSQKTGVALVPGIKPTFTLFGEKKYPITVGFPINAGFFTSGFQGGDGGYGFASAGVVGSVPLAFIPAKFGAWSASASLTYFNTPKDPIPNNPRENFLVSTITVGVSF